VVIGVAGSQQHVVRDLQQFGRLFWLPAGGWGNGLDDGGWAAIIDVRSEHVATLLLMSLREAAVPAYAAVLPGSLRAGRGNSEAASPRVRIWVGAGGYGRGWSTVMRDMPALIERFGPQIVA
jgi:hypothetical protein